MRFRLALPALVAVAAAAVALNAALREESRVDRAVGFVPEGVLAYAHVSIDRDGDDWRRLARAVDRLPSLDTVRASLLSDVPVAGQRIDYERDVRPWLGDEAAVALVPPGPSEQRSSALFVLRTAHEGAARRFLARLTGPAARQERHRGAQVVGTEELAGALDDGFMLLGRRGVIKRALDVHGGGAFALTHDRTYGVLRDRLPDRRVAEAYTSEHGSDVSLFPGLPAVDDVHGDRGVEAAAASLSVEGDRARVAVRALASRPDGACRARDDASLTANAPRDAAAVIQVGRLDCALHYLLRRPRWTLGRIVTRLAAQARRNGVDLRRDVLPLVEGPGTLAVTPARRGAVATLVADGVDEQRALTALGRLQPALVRVVAPELGRRAPGFEAGEADGVPVLTVGLGPAFQLTYGAFDGRLVVSTALEGVAAAHEGGDLGDSDAFRLVLGDLPKRPAAVLFLDLDRLLALGERVGLAEAPAYLAVRDDLQKLGAVGLTLSREGKQTNAELLFKIP